MIRIPKFIFLSLVYLFSCGPEIEPVDFDYAVSEVRQMLHEEAGCEWTNPVEIKMANTTVFKDKKLLGKHYSPEGKRDHHIIIIRPIDGVGQYAKYDDSGTVVSLPRQLFNITLIHEIGHFAGLEHSTEYDDIMYPTTSSLPPGQLERNPWYDIKLKKSVHELVARAKPCSNG